MAHFKKSLQDGIAATLVAAASSFGFFAFNKPMSAPLRGIGDTDSTLILKKLQQETHLKQVIAVDYAAQEQQPLLAKDVERNTIDTATALYIQPRDTVTNADDCDVMNRYQDVDSLLTIAKARHKTHIYYDTRLENPAARPSTWFSSVPSQYKMVSVEDLQHINHKLKQDGKTLGIPEPKLLLRFMSTSNAYNHTCLKVPHYTDAVAQHYPLNVAISLTTGFLAANDEETAEAADSHEVGHYITRKTYAKNFETLAYYRLIAPSDSLKYGMMLLQAQRYWEYESDSVSVVLNGNKGHLKRFFTRQDKHNQAMADTLRASGRVGVGEMTTDSLIILQNYHDEQRRNVDNPHYDHPSDYNRIRNMHLVEAMNNTRDLTEMWMLQSMMPHNPANDWQEPHFPLRPFSLLQPQRKTLDLK